MSEPRVPKKPRFDFLGIKFVKLQILALSTLVNKSIGLLMNNSQQLGQFEMEIENLREIMRKYNWNVPTKAEFFEKNAQEYQKKMTQLKEEAMAKIEAERELEAEKEPEEKNRQ